MNASTQPKTSRARKATSAAEPTKFAKLEAALQEAFGSRTYGDVVLPSAKRVAVATFAVIALSGAAGYGIGTIAAYAMVGVMTLTGSTLLTYLILVVAMLLAAYVGFKIGEHVGNYILSGQIDRDIVAVKNKVTGWFGLSKAKLAAA